MSPYHSFVRNVGFREPLRLSDARCVTMPLCDTSFCLEQQNIRTLKFNHRCRGSLPSQVFMRTVLDTRQTIGQSSLLSAELGNVILSSLVFAPT